MEGRTGQSVGELNHELRLTTRELALVVEIANLLVMPLALEERLRRALARIAENLSSIDAGLILLVDDGNSTASLNAANSEFSGMELAGADATTTIVHTGFVNVESHSPIRSRYDQARTLAQRSMAEGQALCHHADGEVLAMAAELALLQRLCRGHTTPTCFIAVPLFAYDRVIGSLALARLRASEHPLSVDELQLLTGIAHQLGLSVHNALLFRQVNARQAHLSNLLSAVVSAQERERQRIARELHDATGQTLTAIALGLRGIQMISAHCPDFPAQQVAELERFANMALGELHQIIADLRPPQLDDLGLPAALRWYVQDVGRRNGLNASFHVAGNAQPLLNEYEVVLFRIAQEALTNVVKHAAADDVTVTLHYATDRVQLRIQDDGRGFQAVRPLSEQQGWGLTGIQERALLLGGQSSVESAINQGTTVRVVIPLPTIADGAATADSGTAKTSMTSEGKTSR